MYIPVLERLPRLVQKYLALGLDDTGGASITRDGEAVQP